MHNNFFYKYTGFLIFACHALIWFFGLKGKVFLMEEIKVENDM